MKPGKLAAALIILSWLFLAMAFLTSCVAVPVPPFGDHVGEAGTLHIRTSLRFEPRLSESERDAAGLFHALEQFQLTTRTLRDK